MYRYAFTKSAAKDLYAFRRHARLLIRLLSEIIPTVLPDPRQVGEPKHGDLANVYAYAFTDEGISYRLVYIIDDSRREVEFIAFGTHDVAYARAKRRR